jgi:two-component system KDP operon response regulator KdpE
MPVVLIVDGDWITRRTTIAALRYGGIESDTVATVKEAGRRLRRQRYAGVLFDPNAQPERVAELRARTDLPLIVVTAVDDRDDRIDCLDAGADDYLVRPVDPEELLARLRAVQRRTASPPADEPPIVTDDFMIELTDRHVVRADGTEVQLSPIEWTLIEALVRRAGHLVTREELLAAVWGPDAVEKTQYLRVYMASIRHKLEPDTKHPRYFVTAPGLGLKFQVADHQSSAASSAPTAS